MTSDEGIRPQTSAAALAELKPSFSLALGRRGGGVGAAALCGGGGQGQARIISVAEGRKQKLG